MIITIRKYKISLKKEWDEFVESSDNGTIFHKRDFLTYHIGRKFIDHSLLFYQKKHLIAVFSASERYLDGKIVLHSHPGASYGGFVFNKYSFNLVESVINCLENYLKSTLINEVFLVQPPSIYGKKYDETIEYSLKWNNYSTDEIYISSAINLKGNPLTRIHKRKKRYINKPLADCYNLEWNDDFEGFYPILLENKKKHNITPTHTLKELKLLFKRFPNKIKLLMLYKNETPIAGTLNFIANNNVVIIFYNMIYYGYANQQPATHLIGETIKWATTEKYKWLDFGVSQLPLNNNPLSPHKSLIQFKEQFGATGFLRRAYRKKIK
jgi:hypothetical protein